MWHLYKVNDWHDMPSPIYAKGNKINIYHINLISCKIRMKWSYLCGEERLKHVLVTSVTLGLQQSPRSYEKFSQLHSGSHTPFPCLCSGQRLRCPDMQSPASKPVRGWLHSGSHTSSPTLLISQLARMSLLRREELVTLWMLSSQVML